MPRVPAPGLGAPARELVERLRSESAEFAVLWEAHEVATRISDRKRVAGPTGMLELYCRFLTAGAPDQLLVGFTPVAGTNGHRAASVNPLAPARSVPNGASATNRPALGDAGVEGGRQAPFEAQPEP
ncbi:hypothetical protein [Sphaerisporangium sp. NBC_01403]|uniref:MmyB family transcriptional regulator n=1 Tax=Sphaerisporangium sp. NBC_01403 TaxID=2903599 RepID=UPI003867FDE6